MTPWDPLAGIGTWHLVCHTAVGSSWGQPGQHSWRGTCECLQHPAPAPSDTPGDREGSEQTEPFYKSTAIWVFCYFQATFQGPSSVLKGTNSQPLNLLARDLAAPRAPPGQAQEKVQGQEWTLMDMGGPEGHSQQGTEQFPAPGQVKRRVCSRNRRSGAARALRCYLGIV